MVCFFSNFLLIWPFSLHESPEMGSTCQLARSWKILPYTLDIHPQADCISLIYIKLTESCLNTLLKSQQPLLVLPSSFFWYRLTLLLHILFHFLLEIFSCILSRSTLFFPRVYRMGIQFSGPFTFSRMEMNFHFEHA